MRSKMWLRAIPLGLLIVALGVPPQALNSVRPAARRAAEVHAIRAGTASPAAHRASRKASPRRQQPRPTSSIAIESTVVNMDAVVTDQDGNILTGLKRENFRVLDNGQPQQIANFAPIEAPHHHRHADGVQPALWYGYFGYKGEVVGRWVSRPSEPQDWVAFKTFDLKTTLQVDFTQNKNEVLQAIRSLFFPDFSEATLFDAIIETLDQLRDVQGKKSILVLATGFDTFSKHTLDQTLKRLKETDVTIFCVGMGEDIDLYGGGANMTTLQAKNQLNTFAQMTGGYAWFPRFQGEMPDIFNSVAAFLRNQYTIGFTPSTPQDGKFHKLTVEVVDEQGNDACSRTKRAK